MKSILAVLLENEAGALSRVVGLFAQRNYNIESLTVAPTEDPTLSRLTLTTSGDENKITQIRKQLDKLVEVVRVVDLCESPHVERELLLIKVSAQGEARGRSEALGRYLRGQIVDVTAQTYTIQLVGPSEKLDAFVKAVEDSIEDDHLGSGAYRRFWPRPWRSSAVSVNLFIEPKPTHGKKSCRCITTKTQTSPLFKR